MAIIPRKKLQDTLREIFKLPPLPPVDLQAFKDLHVFFGKSYSSSEQEYHEFVNELEDFIENEGRLAVEGLAEDIASDPTTIYKIFTLARWQRVENYVESVSLNVTRSTILLRSIEQ